MAVNCWMVPVGRLGVAGVTAMEDKVAEFTVRSVLPVTPPGVAVMVAEPGPMAVARPLLSTVVTAGFDELQVTSAVMLWLVPSE